MSISTFILFSSCTVPSQIGKPYAARIIDDVPFYPQRAYQCGPAALAGVLNYWGVEVSADEIAKEIYSKSAKGTLNIDLILYSQKNLLNASQYKGNIEDIESKINSGYPLILMVENGFLLYKKNHFMVAIGYDKNHVVVNSGKTRFKFLAKERLMSAWEKTNFWTLLINPD